MKLIKVVAAYSKCSVAVSIHPVVQCPVSVILQVLTSIIDCYI